MHRDVVHENLLCQNGKLKLAGFTLSKKCGDGADALDNDGLCGSPEYQGIFFMLILEALVHLF